MPDQDVNYNLKLKTDGAELQQTAAGLAKIDKRLLALQDKVQDVAKEAKRTGRVLPDAFDSKSIRSTEKALQQAKDAMRDYGDAASRAAKEVEQFGDVGTNISTLRGAIESAGVGGPVAGALLGASELSDSVEAVRRLGPAIDSVAETAVGTSSSLVSLSSGLQSSNLGLSKSAANLVTLGIAAAPVALAVGAAAIAFKDFTDQSKRNAEILSARIQVEDKLRKEIASGSLTTEQAKERLAELNAQLDASRESLQRAREAYGKLEDASGILAPALKLASGEEQVLSDAVKTSRQEVISYQTEIDALTNVLEDGRLAANNAAAAQAKLQGFAEEYGQVIANQTLTVLNAQQQSSDSIKQQIQAIENQKKALEDQIAFQESVGASTTDLAIQYDDLSTLQDRLRTEALGVVEAQEKQARMSEYLADAAEAAKDKFQELADKFQQQQTELANATQAYNDDVERLQQASYEKLAALQEKYNDSLVKAAEKLVDDQQKITDKLNETIANLGQDAAKAQAEAQRDLQQALSDAALESRRDADQAARELRQSRIDEIVDSQRAERDAARDHLLKLKKIRDDAQAEEEDAAANRDFRRLFEIRKQTSRELETASEEFNQERADRQQQLQDRLSDLAIAYQREKQERQIDYQQRINDLQAQNIRERQERQAEYQQRLQDAQQQAQQERQEVQQAYQSQLADLRNKNVQEQQELQRQNQAALELRRQQANDELELISKSASERLAIEKATQEKLIAQARSMLSQIQASASLARPASGVIPPGGIPQFANSTGGASLAGLGGTIYNTTNANRASLSQDNHFYSNNPQDVANQVQSTVKRFFSEIFN